MMRIGAKGALRRTACAALAASALLGAVGGASAEDGLQGFFASIFGGAPQVAPPAASSPRAPVAFRPLRFRQRPLVIRLWPAKPRVVARPRMVYAEAPAKVGPVSIYEDRTLRRGDAVMTRTGVRVFAGSANWPYRPADFVALDAGQIDRGTSKVLAQLDRAPRD